MFLGQNTSVASSDFSQQSNKKDIVISGSLIFLNCFVRSNLCMQMRRLVIKYVYTCTLNTTKTLLMSCEVLKSEFNYLFLTENALERKTFGAKFPGKSALHFSFFNQENTVLCLKKKN